MKVMRPDHVPSAWPQHDSLLRTSHAHVLCTLLIISWSITTPTPKKTLPLHLSLSANGAGVGAQKLLMGLTYGHRSGFPFRNISLLRRYLFLTAFGDATSASKWEQIFSSFVWWWRGGGSNRWPIQPMSLSKTGRSSNLQSQDLILTDANTPSPKKSPSPGSL